MDDPAIFSRYLEGALDTGELAEFKRRLDNDPEFGREFVEFAIETSMMVRVLAEMKESEHAVAGGVRAVRPRLARTLRILVPPALAAGLVLAVGLWWQGRASWQAARHEGQVVARVEAAEGHVMGYGSSVTGEKTQIALKADDDIQAGMRIETGEDGKLTFVCVDDGTKVALKGQSNLDIRTDLSSQDPVSSRRKTFHLSTGHLIAWAAAQSQGQPMAWTTPHARMQVFGTKFLLWATSRRTRLAVEKGRVSLAALGAKSEGVVVGAGEYSDVMSPETCGRMCPRKQVVLRQEALAWRPGRVLWKTDFESEAENRSWEPRVLMSPFGRGAPHEAITMRHPEHALVFARLKLGDRDSTVMIVDDRAVRDDTLGLAVIHPRVQEIMQRGLYALEYDLWIQPSKDGDGGFWRRVSTHMVEVSDGRWEIVYFDNCLVRAGRTNPKTTRWLLNFVFAYIHGRNIVDNLSIRQLDRGKIDMTPVD